MEKTEIQKNKKIERRKYEKRQRERERERERGIVNGRIAVTKLFNEATVF